MQPVLEFIQRHERSYTYSVRAPHKSTVPREACYVDLGLTSLAACVFDAAQALSPNFPRAHISYQGVWMGEIEVSRLRACSEFIAQQLKAEYARRSVAESAVPAAAAG
ncbi:hypothetical protein [Variovorax sp. N23]|uniref:hypothetical protein n=1 Tax=Variovorax sp. N23 TaxID=2980555 RepID=UPI0021C83F4B|nr:hypothetical protein [Variovorax sp. N23]MCU4118686.1 hypothetical protein [Variovorax sp. N23]